MDLFITARTSHSLVSCHRFVIRKETVLPNERTSILSRVLHDDNTLKRIAKAVVAHGNEVSEYNTRKGLNP